MTTKTSADQILEGVARAIRALGCDSETILPVHELNNDLGIDSTEMVELAVLLRQEFGFAEKSLGLIGAVTVEHIVARVEACLASTTI